MVAAQDVKAVIQEYLKEVQKYAAKQAFPTSPNNLYEPLEYALSNSGKALRPILVLMGCEMFQKDHTPALPAALAIEWFHNFTLIHDDIMDDAALRRGKPSVFNKFGTNAAILSGDALLIKAYQQLAKSPESVIADIYQMFNDTALGVCEGQQYDVDFETATTVTEEQYLKMIGLKTAVLLAASVYIGARIGGASESQAMELYKGTYDIGVAFQIQDDILDSFGNEETFGKRIGGDILNDKKTILFIEALKQATAEQKETIELLTTNYSGGEEEKIEAIKQIYLDTKSKEYAEQLRDALFASGIQKIQKNCENSTVYQKFQTFTHWLMHRNV